jgi:hypothetical protein
VTGDQNTVRQLFAPPDSDDVASARFIHHLCAIGDETEVRAGVQRYRDAGPTNPILTGITGSDFALALRTGAGADRDPVLT